MLGIIIMWAILLAIAELGGTNEVLHPLQLD